MFRQRRRVCWNAAAFEVCLGGTCDELQFAHVSRNESRVAKWSDAERDIDALLEKVNDPIDEKDSCIDARVKGQELCDEREEMQPSEKDGRGDGEVSGNISGFASKALLGCFDGFDDATARLEILASRGRECQAPRRAFKQCAAEMGFELSQDAAHRREWLAQRAGGGRQAACLADGNEDAHGSKSIHPILPICGNMLAVITDYQDWGNWGSLVFQR